MVRLLTATDLTEEVNDNKRIKSFSCDRRTPIPPEFTELINRLNQELNQTEQQVTRGLSLTRDLLSRFSDNAILTQYFAYFSTVLFWVENSRKQMQSTVEAVASGADIQTAGEDLAALLGQVLEAKLRVERFIDYLELQL